MGLRRWPFVRGVAGEAPLTRVGTCANCGAPVNGAYCGSCGQETRLSLPTAPAFLRDAFGRYVAFDGRMWRTLALLLVRPGLLTREYLAGRRRRYVRPGRLLLVLALALFAVVRVASNGQALAVLDEAAKPPPAVDELKDAARSAARKSTSEAPLPLPPLDRARGVHVDDDLDISLPGLDTPWLEPVRSRLAAFNKLPVAERSAQITDGVLRYGPYAFVALLPFFAGLMELVYLGRTRRHPGRPDRYAAHLVYGAHNHAFLALALAVVILVPVTLVRTLTWLWILAYLPLSMKVVYGGRWWGVVLRSMLVSVLYLVLFAFAVGLLFVAAVLLK